MNKQICLFFLVSLIFITPIAASIINIPDDYATIQEGIDSSSTGDTVLVQPGTYVENLLIDDHAIVLASLFLTTDDTSYISQTVIDGDSSGSVITISDLGDTLASVIGLTIQYGFNENGGGLHITNSNLQIYKNIIQYNLDVNRGGGIYCEAGTALISNNDIAYNNGSGMYCLSLLSCSITNNIIHSNSGGAIRCSNSSDLDIEGNIVHSNTTNYYGAGIYFNGVYNTSIRNNTIVNNSGGEYSPDGYIYLDNCVNIVITNTILWNNHSQYIRGEISNMSIAVTVSYCDIRGGYNGEGNLNCDPEFCKPSLNNFSLSASSCCLGSGENDDNIGALGLGCEFATLDTIIVPDDYNMIQDAITASWDNDLILVLPGIYYENINFLGKKITVASLYHTTEDTSFINSTIIDGSATNTVINFNYEEDSTSILTGFTLRNGFGRSGNGGAINCKNSSSPIIRYNNIINNLSEGDGGGILIDESSNPLIYLNKIFNNQAQNGGGISIIDNSNPLIYENNIDSNQAEYGAGIYTVDYSNPSIFKNCIINNIAQFGGGIFVGDSSIIIINENNIENNQAEFGAGICIYELARPIILNNNILKNHGLSGGGICCCSQSAPIVSYNYISNNLAQGLDMDGVGGGIIIFAGGNAQVDHNIFHCNRSDQFGGGIACFVSEPNIYNNSLSCNYARIDGGGVYIYDSELAFYNNILWQDSTDTGNNEIYIQSSNPILHHCLIQGGWDGEGNIDEDPLFIDPANGDFHLQANSPCIDTGDPSSPYDPDSTRADIGALYYDQTVSIDDTTTCVPPRYVSTQNYPNPFNASTTISYQLEVASDVSIDIYDILGRKIICLYDGFQTAGMHDMTWNAGKHPSGIYFAKINYSGKTESIKLSLIK